MISVAGAWVSKAARHLVEWNHSHCDSIRRNVAFLDNGQSPIVYIQILLFKELKLESSFISITHGGMIGSMR